MENYAVKSKHSDLTCDCLQEPSLVRSLLYSAVVELLHALWMHHQKILLSFLRAKENFWQDLCAPLYLPPRLVRLSVDFLFLSLHPVAFYVSFYSRSIRSYAQVLNILSSEMYTFGTSIHAPLKDQIKKLFSESNGYLETWSKVSVSNYFKAKGNLF